LGFFNESVQKNDVVFIDREQGASNPIGKSRSNLPEFGFEFTHEGHSEWEAILYGFDVFSDELSIGGV